MATSNRSLEQSLAIVSERGYATTGAYSKRSSTWMLRTAFERVADYHPHEIRFNRTTAKDTKATMQYILAFGRQYPTYERCESIGLLSDFSCCWLGLIFWGD